MINKSNFNDGKVLCVKNYVKIINFNFKQNEKMGKKLNKCVPIILFLLKFFFLIYIIKTLPLYEKYYVYVINKWQETYFDNASNM